MLAAMAAVTMWRGDTKDSASWFPSWVGEFRWVAKLEEPQFVSRPLSKGELEVCVRVHGVLLGDVAIGLGGLESMSAATTSSRRPLSSIRARSLLTVSGLLLKGQDRFVSGGNPSIDWLTWYFHIYGHD